MAANALGQLLVGVQAVGGEHVLARNKTYNQGSRGICNEQRQQNYPAPHTHLGLGRRQQHHKPDDEAQKTAAAITHKDLGRRPVQNGETQHRAQNKQADPGPLNITQIQEIQPHTTKQQQSLNSFQPINSVQKILEINQQNSRNV